MSCECGGGFGTHSNAWRVMKMTYSLRRWDDVFHHNHSAWCNAVVWMAAW